VPEVLLRLCRDVGVNPGEDPESSLMFWLKNIEKKVMDNIEQLVEEEMRSEFTELVVTLRKNLQQRLQILTTTRTEFSIPEQTTENVQIGELDEKSSVELLRKCCPNTEVKDSYLCDLANLCGFIPLALCIAGPRIADLDDPFELIHWLKERSVKTLLTSDKSQCARKAIEFSFQQLNDDLAKLKYLGQVLEEALRKYPVAPAPSRVLAKDITVGGYHIPKGNEINSLQMFFSMNPEIWENPEVFDPERFSDAKNIPNFSMTHFPFSIGPRNCIGQTFAKFESKVILAKLLQKFQFRLLPGQTNRMKARLTMTPRDGVMCEVTKRT
jgi:hypothetical protein